MFQIPLSIVQNFLILSRNKVGKSTKATIMIAIDEDEEKIIDNIDKSIISFTRGNKTFEVTMKDIYCYGEIDFEDKNTLDKINTFKFLDYLGNSGIYIYSNYDYEHNAVNTPKKHPMWTETWSPLQLIKYAHGRMGKPQRVLLFNQIIK